MPMDRPSALRAESSTGGTVHIVGQRNNRAVCFITPDDFLMLVAHPSEMARTYGVIAITRCWRPLRDADDLPNTTRITD